MGIKPEKKKLLDSASPNDINVQLQREFLGNTAADWGKVVLCLVVLYFGVGFLYAGLLSTAIEIRQEGWLELPRVFFGKFDKQERRLVDANTNMEVPIKVPDVDVLAERGVIPTRKFNRPRGCEPAEINGADVLLCDKNHKAANHQWTLYPWVVQKGVNAGMSGCSSAATDHAAVLNADGTYAGAAVCINSVASGVIPP